MLTEGVSCLAGEGSAKTGVWPQTEWGKWGHVGVGVRASRQEEEQGRGPEMVVGSVELGSREGHEAAGCVHGEWVGALDSRVSHGHFTQAAAATGGLWRRTC